MNFTVVDGNNNEIKLNIIKIFNTNNLNYVIYYDENDEIYASRFHVEKGNYVLDPIENENEWDLIDKELEKIGE